MFFLWSEKGAELWPGDDLEDGNFDHVEVLEPALFGPLVLGRVVGEELAGWIRLAEELALAHSRHLGVGVDAGAGPAIAHVDLKAGAVGEA